MSTRPVGVIGTGEFADDAANRLATAGQRVLRYTLAERPKALPRLIEAAPTMTDIGFDCGIVLSFVDDSVAFRDVLIGTPEKTGLGAELNPGAIVVDFGVRPPRETQALLGAIGMRGIAILDAAIIGSGIAGEIATVMVGGYIDSVEKSESTLALIGRVERTGPLGSAHTAAALMGYMEAAHSVARTEAAAVGKALGLSNATLARVIDKRQEHHAPNNIIRLEKRTGLAARLAADHGLSAEVIDFTSNHLKKHSTEAS